MSDQLRDLITHLCDGPDGPFAASTANSVLNARLPWLHSTPTLADTVALWEAVHGAEVIDNNDVKVSFRSGNTAQVHRPDLLLAVLRAVESR